MRRPVRSLVDLHARCCSRSPSPALGLKLGASGVSTLPDRLESKRGYEALARDFPQASASPALIAVAGDVRSPPVHARDRAAARAARARPRLRPQRPAGDAGRRLGRDRRRRSAATRRASGRWTRSGACARRRSRARSRGTDARVLVGGDTADNVDFIDAMNAWLPIVFVFVLGLSFVLLTVVFRSIVIAATSIVLNLLSVGAAYGLVILVFRHGIGSGLLGFQRVDAIEAWVPLFLFSVLFGLSMDYQVFLLSRIKERYDADAARPTTRSSTASRRPRA